MNPAHKNKVIIAVDDNPEILIFIDSYLSQFEFDLYTAQNGRDARLLIKEHGIDLLLVDLRLENESGLDFAKEIFAFYHVPIIMVSAISDDIEKVVGLETVLSDYVEKPIEPRLLLARIRAQLRSKNFKVESANQTVALSNKNNLLFGDFILNQEKLLLSHCQLGPVELTNTEFRLLELLVANSGIVLSRQEIVDQLDLESSNHMMRSIDVLVLRLRRKIELKPSTPRFLQTRRNKGYVFCRE